MRARTRVCVCACVYVGVRVYSNYFVLIFCILVVNSLSVLFQITSYCAVADAFWRTDAFFKRSAFVLCLYFIISRPFQNAFFVLFQHNLDHSSLIRDTSQVTADRKNNGRRYANVAVEHLRHRSARLEKITEMRKIVPNGLSQEQLLVFMSVSGQCVNNCLYVFWQALFRLFCVNFFNGR